MVAEVARDPTKLLDQMQRQYGRAAPRNHAVTLPQVGMDTMRTRTCEMLLATCMMSAGLTFALPGETTSLPHLMVMREWVEIFPGTEFRFGVLIFLVGVVRWIALVINGHYHRTPLARLVGCVVGSLFWVSVVIATASASNLGGVPLLTGFLMSFAVFETFCTMRATRDAFYMRSFSRNFKWGPRDVGRS